MGHQIEVFDKTQDVCAADNLIRFLLGIKSLLNLESSTVFRVISHVSSKYLLVQLGMPFQKVSISEQISRRLHHLVIIEFDLALNGYLADTSRSGPRRWFSHTQFLDLRFKWLHFSLTS